MISNPSTNWNNACWPFSDGTRKLLFPFQWTFTRKDLAVLLAKIENKRFAPRPDALSSLESENQEAGALPCTNRACMNQIEALGVSFEREADSPICWKQQKRKQEMECLE
jgi:hypothetical protein